MLIMESDEPFLRPCKQLPSPTNDRHNSHSSMGQHLGTQTLGQGLTDNRSSESSQERSTGLEDTDDETSQYGQDSTVGASEHAGYETSEEKVARLLKGKEKDWVAAAKKEGPLRLLDLPLDILKIIFKEVTHTNDLANCAKVNSALHALTTPTIYSRFDIVWPDSLNSAETRAGVDALTYGLATLVMREDLFENVLYPSNASCGSSCQSYECPHCRSISYISNHEGAIPRLRRSRRGNYFSQFVKKFSLGNGPTEWVQEYLVTKEGGKMLGTLVALSIARMPNLESFVWDMPTGVLRDIWIALSSLGDHRPSKLEKLWIRFHDNRAALNEAGLLGSTRSTDSPQAGSGPAAAALSPPSQYSKLMEPGHYGVKKLVWFDHHVEKPNFSKMPPLRSLSVLEIDEARYLVELSVLIGNSLGSLRELRVGMAPTLSIPPCLQANQEAAALFTGGVFTLLMSNIYDHYKALCTMKENLKEQTHDNESMKQESPLNPSIQIPTTLPSNLHLPSNGLDRVGLNSPNIEEAATSLGALASPIFGAGTDAIDPALSGEGPSPTDDRAVANGETGIPAKLENAKEELHCNHDDLQNLNGEAAVVDDVLNPTKKLKLEVLELERLTKLVPRVLCRSIDFTMLTSLTLLQCGDQSGLWDRLRKDYAPRKSLVVSLPTQGSKNAGPQPRLRRKPSSDPLVKDVEYRLQLKKIHTDAVSSDLISFLRATLAPNSLEWMFFQDTETFISPVTLEAIYRGPLRRHRTSLTKVMIDSAYGPMPGRARVQAARKWMLNREVLTFVTSGKMSKLRELSMAIEYKDWHLFLQRLPNVPHLRSLHVPNIADHPYGSSLDIKDFARGAIDVVALRPEVELCYLAIKDKCFEILERKHTKGPKGQTSTASDDSDNDTQDGDHHHDDDEDDEDSDDGGTAAIPPPIEPGAMDSDTGSITTDDEESDPGQKEKMKLSLREILFYDDKISIFKARHGRL